MSTDLGDRYWSKVDKTASCWLWLAGKNSKGYGVWSIRRRSHYAHRIAFADKFGPIPEGMQVDHICHNRACVNPDHLRLVTSKQNSENLSGACADSKTGVLGVSWHKGNRKWRASVGHQGRTYAAGSFDRIEDAEAAAKAKRNELFTHNDRDRNTLGGVA